MDIKTNTTATLAAAELIALSVFQLHRDFTLLTLGDNNRYVYVRWDVLMTKSLILRRAANYNIQAHYFNTLVNYKYINKLNVGLPRKIVSH